MSEKPILFNSEMVRALLSGRKTQTRRPVRFTQWVDVPVITMVEHGPFVGQADNLQSWSADHCSNGTIVVEQGIVCPFGLIGDRLWVRETFTIETNFNLDPCDPPFTDGRPVKWTENEEYGRYWEQAHYRATDPSPDLVHEDDCRQCEDNGYCNKWKPSLHMPRWASRILLEITDVRSERIQKISEVDALCEGQHAISAGVVSVVETTNLTTGITRRHVMKNPKAFSSRQRFKTSWDNIYPGSWDRNDWVWVIEFKRVTPT